MLRTPLRRTLVALALVAGSVARADVPNNLGYQGRLFKADGTPASGSFSLGFAVYDSESGGTLLWTETQKLSLSDGFYATRLGEVTPIPDDLFAGSQRYLEVSVAGEALLRAAASGLSPMRWRRATSEGASSTRRASP